MYSQIVTQRSTPESLEMYVADLENASFCDEANTFRELDTAVKAESEFWRRATRIGCEAARAFVERRLRATNALRAKISMLTEVNDNYKTQYEALYDRLPDISKYEDRCKAHDWAYRESDDIFMFRRGAEQEKVLLAEARQKGQAYIDVFNKIGGRSEPLHIFTQCETTKS